MKYFFLIILFSFSICAKSQKTIHVKQPGSLASMLGSSITSVENLVVSGNINDKDMMVLAKMVREAKLREIDLGGCYLSSGRIGGDDDYNFCETKLQSFILPQNTYTINDFMFNNCYSLRIVRAPNKLKVIGKYAFVNTILESLDLVSENIMDGAFVGVFRQEVKIPEGVVYIGCNAFENTRKAILPKSIKSIGLSAFEDDAVLYLSSINPPLIVKCGFNCKYKVFIPKNSYSNYWSTEWSKHELIEKSE